MITTSKIISDRDEDLATLLEDPARFCQMCWPKIRLYDKQLEVLESVRDNQETFVHAANELGKDFIAAIVAIWFFASRAPARVITSSSGETQLKAVLWSEIKERLDTSEYAFPFNRASMSLKRRVPIEGGGWGEEPLSYVIGHVTKTVENFQGHHLDHDKARVLCIFDEASGIGDAFYEAAQSWAHRILIIGNPLSTTNFFYRGCKQGDKEDPAGSPGLLRKVIHIGAEHSPNVKLGRKLAEGGMEPPYPTVIPGVVSYEELLRRTELWDRIRRTQRLDGHFYEGEEMLLCPPHWLDGAHTAYRNINDRGYDDHTARWKTAHGDPRKVLSMGCDGAAGRDLTSWHLIDKDGIIEEHSVKTPNTMEIAGQTIEYIRRHNIDPRKVCFDAGGGGKQIVDRLREQGFNVRAVAFGGAATPPKEARVRTNADKVEVAEDAMVYKNRRCQMYGLLRSLLDPSMNEPVFAIPEEHYLLRQELAPLPLQFDSEGKMWLPPKDKPARTGKSQSEIITLKQILGRSPDRADSLVLAIYAMLVRAPRMSVGAF